MCIGLNLFSFPFAGMLLSLSILLLTLLEDNSLGGHRGPLASGNEATTGRGGVNALRFTRQTKAATSSIVGTKIRRGSEATATKLGPAFHTEPPEKFTFSNDTGKPSCVSRTVCKQTIKETQYHFRRRPGLHSLRHSATQDLVVQVQRHLRHDGERHGHAGRRAGQLRPREAVPDEATQQAMGDITPQQLAQVSTLRLPRV